ncbi:F-box/WD-40 repeat-containing protein [Vitis vinifera]|uniref:F-box/WD-40 repeat-containing protein n=1 Tax=Vitis vinifera TaxID=29760 RepID=A0A438DZE3_VITVI|nr:F-box/WD-40 repeat-containing protein [Vitis vinifera]
MDGTTADGQSQAQKRMSSRVPATSLAHDILCMIFVLLDLFDLVRCSAVCKSWNKVINKSKLLQILYHKQQGGSIGPSSTSHCSEKPLKVCIEQLAMEHHRLSLQGLIDIEQWKGHSVRAGQCRMKMGLILTGVGDKMIKSYWSLVSTVCLDGGLNVAVRLWSLESYKCLEEHFLPNLAPLVDFDFDENKIVGLIGTRICIWRRNGKRSIFPSREGTFMKGLCMRYIDPEAVVGCEDGTARVFDMYSRKCSRIIRYTLPELLGSSMSCSLISLSNNNF